MVRKRLLSKIALILLILSLFFLIYFLISLETASKTEEKIVTKIIDGDTIIIEGGERVRFLGVDCDEKGKECYTPAKNYTEASLLGKAVLLESDVEDLDIYGRKLRYIFLNRENFNTKLVKNGYCVARFEGDTKYKSEIQQAEQFAIKNKVGCKWD